MLPFTVTPNQAHASSRINVRLMYPSPMRGRIFPSINSAGRIGVTTSCSSVPSSRSRTIAPMVRKVVVNCSTSPSTPGTMKSWLCNFGLYQPHLRLPGVQSTLDLLQVAGPVADRKIPGVLKSGHQRAALGGLRLIPHRRGLMQDFIAEVSVQHHLNDGQGDDRAQRPPIAQQLGGLFTDDAEQALDVHPATPRSDSARATKTSSSVGGMGSIPITANPPSRRNAATSGADSRWSTTAWIATPYSAASRTAACLYSAASASTGRSVRISSTTPGICSRLICAGVPSVMMRPP